MGVKNPIQGIIDKLEIKLTPFLTWNDECILELYEREEQLHKYVSLRYFKKSLGDSIQEAAAERKPFSVNDYSVLLNRIRQIKEKDFEVLYDLYGGKLDKSHLELGDYTIYNFTLDKSLLNKKSVHFESQFDKVHRNGDSNPDPQNLLISVKVRAKEVFKAMELADVLISKFENIMAFIGGDLLRRKTVDILNHAEDERIVRYALHEGTSTLSLNRNAKIDIDFNDDHLFCAKCGNDRIWKISASKNPNKIERRILNAIEWVGKGVREKDKAKALIQFTFAIEGMLQHEVDKIINPSIMSLLGDTAAFCLSDNVDGRMAIAKQIRDIYKARSSVAHGSTSNVEDKIWKMSAQIASKLIRVFLSKEPFRRLKSPDELRNYIERLKFQ